MTLTSGKCNRLADFCGVLILFVQIAVDQCPCLQSHIHST